LCRIKNVFYFRQVSSQLSIAPRQGLNPRQAETVERLLEAGEQELRAVGHEALTIRTVATRAGVSPATAYTYLASKNHLYAELFLRFLVEDRGFSPRGRTAVRRVQSVTRRLSERLAGAPALAAAVTPALLGSDADVQRLRLRIGNEFVDLFRAALGSRVDPHVLDALVLALSGALLQAGVGLITYADLAERLDSVVEVIMRGNR
jgi:AcrR family transcriptional regulator